MRYAYSVYRADGVREDLTTRFEEVEKLVKQLGFTNVYVEDQLSEMVDSYWLRSEDDMIQHRMMLERRQWIGKAAKAEGGKIVEMPITVNVSVSDTIKAAVNPSHHKSFLAGKIGDIEIDLQWLEGQQLLPKYRDPELFIAAVELQVRKYLDRNGKKDDELQEFMKAKWYLDFIIAYIKNGKKPIRVEDIPALLAS